MPRFQRLTASICCLLVCGALASCSSKDEADIVAASPTAITITTARFNEPLAQAQDHCAKHGKQAKSRGGVKLGAPAYKVMWGFDCVAK